MPTFQTILTNVGLAQVSNAIALEQTISLTEMAVGDGSGSPTTPDQEQTELVNEVYRASLNSLDVDEDNPAYVIAEMIVPAAEGGFTVREVGIFDDDDNLIAVANFPETYKPAALEGSTRDLIIRIYLEVVNPDVVELKIDPSLVLASRAWVESNFLSKGKVEYTATGTNDYVLTRTHGKPEEEYYNGQLISFKVPNANTDACTVNINAIGEIDLTQFDGTALASGDLVAGDFVIAMGNLSSSRFEILMVKGNGNLDNSAKFLADSPTFTVDTSGADFTTVNAALEYLTKNYYPIYKNTGVRATINIETGYELSEQLIFDGIDCSWITITSTDAEVTVIRSALTTSISGRYPAICAANGGRSAYINYIGNMDTSGSSTGRNGIYAINGGIVNGEDFGIKGAGLFGCEAVNSCIAGISLNVDSSTSNGISSTNGGILIFSNSITATNCGGIAVAASRGSKVACGGTINATGGSSGGTNSSYGSIISASNINNEGTTTGCAASRCGIISADTIYNNNCTNRGANATSGGKITSNTMDNTGCTTNGAYADAGGKITAFVIMNNRKGVSDDPTDTVVIDGGYIARNSGNGGLSQTAGTMTSAGYINK
jgi:hypothetical protein